MIFSRRAWQKALPASFFRLSIWLWATSPAFCLTSSTMLLKMFGVGVGWLESLLLSGAGEGVLVGSLMLSGRILLKVLAIGWYTDSPSI